MTSLVVPDAPVMRLTDIALGDISMTEPPPARMEDAYGLMALVGPFGSSKTLLAVHFAHSYAGRYCGGQDCGVEGCQETWTVYSNIPSTWSWALPLRATQDLLRSRRPPTHAILLFDEGHEYSDPRRNMSTFALQLTHKMMQVRHQHNKALWTSPSIKMIDSRLVGVMSKIYLPWTPDRGRRSYAVVYNRATGNIPPWERNRLRPKVRLWWTEDSKRLFDTHDTVDARSDVAAARTRGRIIVTDEQGQDSWTTVDELVLMAIDGVAITSADSSTLRPEQIRDWLVQTLNLELPLGEIDGQLDGSGLMKLPDGSYRVRAGRLPPVVTDPDDELLVREVEEVEG